MQRTLLTLLLVGVFDPNTNYLSWRFEVSLKKPLDLARVVVTDVTKDPVVVMVEDSAPVAQGKWSGRHQDLPLTPEAVPWLFTAEDTMKVFHILLVTTKGEKHEIYQATWFSGATKQQMRQALKLPEPSVQKTPEFWLFNFDGRSWELGLEQLAEKQAIREYVLNGEKVENWTELVTSFVGRSEVSLKTWSKQLEAHLRQRCTSVEFVVLDKEKDSLLVEWRSAGCGDNPPEHQLLRCVEKKAGKDRFLLTLAYVAKVPRLSADRRAAWVGILRQATLKKN